MHNFKNLFEDKRGQGLIEVLVALGIAVVIIAAISRLTLNSLNNAQFGKDQSAANNYAQEGMDFLRKVRNSDWNAFSSLNGVYCLAKDSMTLQPEPAGGCPQNVDVFKRTVAVAATTNCSFSTIGNSAIGTTTFSNASSYKTAYRTVTGSSGGTVNSASVFVGTVDAASNNQYSIAIYSDSGGAPAALLAQTQVGTLAELSWNTASFAIPVTLLGNTPYWFAYETNGSTGSVNNFLISPGSSNQLRYNATSWSGNSPNWPAAFGALTGSSNDMISLYVTVSSAGGVDREGSVIVAWTDSKCPNDTFCHKVQINSCFSSLVVPTP